VFRIISARYTLNCYRITAIVSIFQVSVRYVIASVFQVSATGVRLHYPVAYAPDRSNCLMLHTATALAAPDIFRLPDGSNINCAFADGQTAKTQVRLIHCVWVLEWLTFVRAANFADCRAQC
jgi:hypothetical protein